ncbi:MAG TPA: methyltransferase domain-containing protein [Gemmatimonadaceae bacterium]
MESVSQRRDGGDPDSNPGPLVERSWITNADAWTRAVREGRIASRREGTDAAILQAVLVTAPATALDVGCGEGWLARKLAESGVDVVGIDSSPLLVERARELGGGRFQVVSYDELAASRGTAPGPFDAIVCNFSLFTKELTSLLRALARRLSPTGTLFIQTAHPGGTSASEDARDGWRTERFDAFDIHFPAAMPWYFRTLDSWRTTLAAAGLRIAQQREPASQATGEPLSLLLECRSVGG